MISFWKLLLLVLVIAGAWTAVTIYKRSVKQREIRERTAQAPEVAHIRTVSCRVCGTYIPERGAARCGRADCPV